MRPPSTSDPEPSSYLLLLDLARHIATGISSLHALEPELARIYPGGVPPEDVQKALVALSKEGPSAEAQAMVNVLRFIEVKARLEALMLLEQGSAWLQLARGRTGPASEERRQYEIGEALACYRAAERRLDPARSYYGRVRASTGAAQTERARTGIDPQTHLNEAFKCFQDAADCLDLEQEPGTQEALKTLLQEMLQVLAAHEAEGLIKLEHNDIRGQALEELCGKLECSLELPPLANFDREVQQYWEEQRRTVGPRPEGPNRSLGQPGDLGIQASDNAEIHVAAAAAKTAYRQLHERLRALLPPRTCSALPLPEVVVQLRRLTTSVGDASRPLLVEYVWDGHTLQVLAVRLWGNHAPEHLPVPCTVPDGIDPFTGIARELYPDVEHPRLGLKPAALRQACGALTPLIEPWATLLAAGDDPERPTELLLSPQALQDLPLHTALWETRPLIEHIPVSYLPGPLVSKEMSAWLEHMQGSSEAGLAIGSQALVCGEPRSGEPEIDANLLAFPTGRDEAQAVTALLEQKGYRALPLTGTLATSQAILEGSAEAFLWHFCGRVELDSEEELGGLELANRRISLLEVSRRLPLRQTRMAYLATLSYGAVGTTAAAVRSLQALARAFIDAGAATVVTARWPVDPTAAATFREHYYAAWTNGQSATAAFQRAVLALQETHRSSAWAAFVLHGSPESRIPAPRGLE